jgi:hypothetical protein
VQWGTEGVFAFLGVKKTANSVIESLMWSIFHRSYWLYYGADIFEFYVLLNLMVWTAAVHRPSREEIILRVLLLDVCSE